ncbi:hypothetical protein PABG_01322 [Paracoccidioides brasiliensis Pb03]|nr:hypothetical protein PABG_01322 [Paracoccidioides brasiliensis Pb03]
MDPCHMMVGLGLYAPPKLFRRPDKNLFSAKLFPASARQLRTISSQTTSLNTNNRPSLRLIIRTRHICLLCEMETETKKDLSVSPLPPGCNDDLNYLKTHVDKAVSWQTLSTSLKESMEPLDHSRVETILRAVKAKHSKFRIFKIVDRTRFIINREPVHIIPISSDLVISNRPDKSTAITVPVGSGVYVTETICYIHAYTDLLTI